jgi:hypothetical protein
MRVNERCKLIPNGDLPLCRHWFSIFTFLIVYQPRDHGHNDVFGGHEWQLGQDSAFDHLLVHHEAFKDVLASMIMFFFGTDAAAK